MQTITTTVEIATDDQPYGAGRIFEIDAEATDFGPDWATDDDAQDAGAQARYALVTSGHITHIGAGGAILNRNPHGDPSCQWLDDCPADSPESLAQVARSEWEEFGSNPLADDESDA